MQLFPQIILSYFCLFWFYQMMNLHLFFFPWNTFPFQTIKDNWSNEILKLLKISWFSKKTVVKFCPSFRLNVPPSNDSLNEPFPLLLLSSQHEKFYEAMGALELNMWTFKEKAIFGEKNDNSGRYSIIVRMYFKFEVEVFCSLWCLCSYVSVWVASIKFFYEGGENVRWQRIIRINEEHRGAHS